MSSARANPGWPAMLGASLVAATLGCTLGCTNDYDIVPATNGGAGASSATTVQGVGGASSSSTGVQAGGAGGQGGDGGMPAGPGSGGTGGAPCPPTSLGAELAAAYPSTQSKVIDGQLADWGCHEPLLLDSSNAAFMHPNGGGGTKVTLRARFEWDAEQLYFAAEVVDDTPGEGDDAELPYQNDSVELYLRGASAPHADYGPFDHHFIVDHKGLELEHSPPSVSNDLDPSALQAAVVPSADGYRIEARVEADVLGERLHVGRKLGLDLLVSDGEKQARYLVWALADHGSCGLCAPDTCCCQDNGGGYEMPFCNTLVFGELELF